MHAYYKDSNTQYKNEGNVKASLLSRPTRHKTVISETFHKPIS